MKKILVVDDEKIIRASIQRIFRYTDIEVLEAESAEEALKMIDDEIGVVLSDISMPGMGGVALADEIRKSHPGLAVILMTGVDSNSPATKDWKESGAIKLLLKPFDIDELESSIRDLLR